MSAGFVAHGRREHTVLLMLQTYAYNCKQRSKLVQSVFGTLERERQGVVHFIELNIYFKK